MKSIAKILITVITGCLLLLSCYGSRTQEESLSNSPSSTLCSYYDAMQQSDYQKAINYINCLPDEKPEIMTLMLYSTGINGELTSYSIVSEKINDKGDTAEVIVKTYHSKIEVSESIQKLVKVKGNWKIQIM